MNIIYLVHQYFPRHVGGTEVLTRGLVRRVVKEGFNPIVITCHESESGDPDEFHMEETEYEGIPLLELHFNLSVTPHPARCEYDNPFIAEKIRLLLQRFNPALAHVMHAMKLSVSPLDVCHEAGIPVIVSLCDFWFICPRHSLLTWDGKPCTGPDSPLKCIRCVHDLHGFAPLPKSPRGVAQFFRDVAAIEMRTVRLRRSLLRSRRIFALSRFQKRMFVENGYPEDRIELIVHGIDLADLLPAGAMEGKVLSGDGTAGRSGDRPSLGFVGTLVPMKGLHVLLDALDLLRGSGVELKIFGPLREDPYVSQIRERASRMPNVNLHGGFKPSEFGRVMRSFDALAMPALWYENDPLVIKAALHFGMPVLASRRGSLEEMIEDGRNGWLIEPNRPDKWARAIRKFVDGHPHSMAPTRVPTMEETAGEFAEVYRREARRPA